MSSGPVQYTQQDYRLPQAPDLSADAAIAAARLEDLQKLGLTDPTAANDAAFAKQQFEALQFAVLSRDSEVHANKEHNAAVETSIRAQNDAQTNNLMGATGSALATLAFASAAAPRPDEMVVMGEQPAMVAPTTEADITNDGPTEVFEEVAVSAPETNITALSMGASAMFARVATNPMPQDEQLALRNGLQIDPTQQQPAANDPQMEQTAQPQPAQTQMVRKPRPAPNMAMQLAPRPRGGGMGSSV
jgi:hypothetical protein